MHPAQRVNLEAEVTLQAGITGEEDLHSILPVEGGLSGEILLHHHVVVSDVEGEVETLGVGERAELGGEWGVF